MKLRRKKIMTNKQKQRQLQYLGYYGGEIDGKLGTKTNAATASFQKDFGLESDGYFGPLTQTETVEVIKIIQKAIGLKGISIDGYAGTKTKKATKKYQKSKGLVEDGIAGKQTRATIPELNVDFWDTVKYFKKEEFKCHCNGKYCKGYPVDIDQTLIRVAERARKYFGRPITVSSGVRCNQHNANVGGVWNSRHKLGKAMDFTVAGVSPSTVKAWAKKQPEIRYTYVIDAAYVHMDVY
jgi:peptidoglycan hydrolase-like protein with peptidoglycan-binding domain